jgi:uncharacterized membrane protein
MLHVTERVSGGVLWANLHLLFWLSLIPFVTGWMGENHFAPVPVALYGAVLFMAAIAYTVLQWKIMHIPGGSPVLRKAIGLDLKGKLSLVAYAAAVVCSLAISPWIASALYVLVALMWLIPDRRIEHTMQANHV